MSTRLPESKKRKPSLRLRHAADNFFTYLALIVVSLIFFFPCLWLILSSLSKSGSLYDIRGFFPAEYSLQTFITLFTDDVNGLYPYGKWFFNTLYVASMSCLFGTMLVILTGYVMSRFRFKGRDALFFVILMLMVLPFQVTMVPSVISLRFMGIMETPWAVILPMWFSPFYIFLIRQFMMGLPNELLEAGMMDGAGPLRCYLHVVLPVCRPILGAAVALSFADCWNMVEQPLVYLANRAGDQPLSVMFNQISIDGADVAFAGAALYILPALFVYFYFQEDILLGVTLSELK